MKFTKEEFEIMVHELLYKEEISFDMLVKIAEKTLKSSVRSWCNKDSRLKGRGYEDDILQDVYIRLLKTTITHFLLRKGIKGEYNDNPEGFEDWLFSVGRNLTEDYARRIGISNARNGDLDDLEGAETSDLLKIEDNEENVARLKEAFSIVIMSDYAVYKVLTWIAGFIFMGGFGVSKIKSTAMTIGAFQDKSLFEMYDMILEASKRISWLKIGDEENEKIQSALRKKTDSGVLFGESKYKDFFMKQNGVVSGKKSVSDWNYRMNEALKNKMLKGLIENESLKNAETKKRRGTNGASGN